jgi:CHAT domain-containing protein
VVTLNACQVGRAGYKLTSIGGFARAFLSKGAGLFISSMWSVGDGTARTFTETLYRGLLDGKKLSEATIAAREASRKAGEATWLAYTVYGHPDATLAR